MSADIENSKMQGVQNQREFRKDLKRLEKKYRGQNYGTEKNFVDYRGQWRFFVGRSRRGVAFEFIAGKRAYYGCHHDD